MENKIIIELLYCCFLLLLFNISLEDLSSCNYPMIRRLVFGNYLLICSNKIYFYDSNLENLISNISTPSCASSCNYYTSSAQFLVEDGEYVIVVQNAHIYIFNKNGIFLSSKSIDYFSNTKPNSLVPYGHSNKNYYYVIIYINEKNIYFKQYIFNSLNNELLLNQTFSYTTNITGNLYPENGISCTLMKYSNKNVIACFYGTEYIYACTVFDPFNNFQNIQNLEPKFMSISEVGGTHYSSVVMTESMKKAVSCRGLRVFFCVSYDISLNNLSKVIKINERSCNVPSRFSLKYIFETQTFIMGCYDEDGYFHLGTYSEDLNYKFLGKISNLFSTSCSISRADLVYSSTIQKYLVITGSSCGIESQFNNINGTKIQDYPEKNISCDNYYYENNCFDEIPEGYYCDDITHKRLLICH